MQDLRFLDKGTVLAFHQQQIELFGGDPGMRDDGLLDSALAQPQNLYVYEQGDVFDYAAAYAFSIAKNHPFVDGNKRTALQAALAFLKQNNLQPDLSENSLYNLMIGLTESKVTRQEFASRLYEASTRDWEHPELEAKMLRILREKAGRTPEDTKAFLIDCEATLDKAFFVQKHEEVHINPERFNTNYEEFLYRLVPKELRSQFGIKISGANLED